LTASLSVKTTFVLPNVPVLTTAQADGGATGLSEASTW
jgi:hypothetical protein